MRVSKNKLIKIIDFHTSDYHGLELYLEEMASKGWMLEEIYPCDIFKFKKCEPKNLKFTLDTPPIYSDNIDIYLEKYNKTMQEYIDMCKSSGWEHLINNSKYQIFYTDKLDAIPIQTDDSLKLGQLIKFDFRMLFQIFWPMIMFISNRDLYFQEEYKDMMLLFFGAAFYFLVLFAQNFSWQIYARKSLKENKQIIYYSLNLFKINLAIKNTVDIMMTLFIITILIFINNNNMTMLLSLVFSCMLIVLAIILLINFVKEILRNKATKNLR